MEFRRHITFCRKYNDDSGMPEWPRGSRRAVCFRFDSSVTERDFVMHMMHNPAEFKPYFDTPPLHVRHVITAPTGQGTGPYDAIQFSRWVRSDHADHASIELEWRNDNLGAITPSLHGDNSFHLSATFPVYDDASIENFCRWIVQRRFNGLQHKDAIILFSAYAVPPHPDFPGPAASPHHGTLYHPHPLARSISSPFAVAAAADDDAAAVAVASDVPASPAGSVIGGSSSSEESEDEMAIPEADSDSDDDAIPQPDPDPEPVDLFGDNDNDNNNNNNEAAPQADSFAQRALRRISDELFDAQQDMPEAVYVRLSNSLKRRLGE